MPMEDVSVEDAMKTDALLLVLSKDGEGDLVEWLVEPLKH
jgi:hypothetical protein